MTFEESMKRLDKIAEILDGGSTGLDESLALYKEGVELIARLNKIIDDAEKSITEERDV